jgi:hypothetical protein
MDVLAAFFEKEGDSAYWSADDLVGLGVEEGTWVR